MIASELHDLSVVVSELTVSQSRDSRLNKYESKNDVTTRSRSVSGIGVALASIAACSITKSCVHFLFVFIVAEPKDLKRGSSHCCSSLSFHLIFAAFNQV